VKVSFYIGTVTVTTYSSLIANQWPNMGSNRSSI